MVQFTIELGIDGANAVFWLGAVNKGSADAGGTFNYNVNHMSGDDEDILTIKKAGYSDTDITVYNATIDLVMLISYSAFDSTPPSPELYPHG